MKNAKLRKTDKSEPFAPGEVSQGGEDYKSKLTLIPYTVKACGELFKGAFFKAADV